MEPAAFYALFTEVLAFTLIALRCAWIYLTTGPQPRGLLCLPGDEEHRVVDGQFLSTELEPTEGSGANTRRRVQGILAIACFARAVVTVFIIIRRSWMPYLAVPDLVYISTYGQLVLFLAQTQQTAVGVGHRNVGVKLGGAAILAVVLLVSLAMCAERWRADPEAHLALLFRRMLYFELGITYLMLCAAFTYCGSRVIFAARMHKATFNRMLLLTTICGLALLCKGTSFVTAAAKAWRTEELFPTSATRYRFESAVALEELLPSLAILMLTEKSKSRPYPASPVLSETSTFARYPSSPFYTSRVNMSPVPQLHAEFGGYGAAINPA